MTKDTARKTAAYQIIRSMLDHIFGSDVPLSKNNFYHIYRLYNKEGGSWQTLMVGDMDSFMLLKSILESYVEINKNKKKYGLK